MSDWRKGFHRAVVDTVLRLGDRWDPATQYLSIERSLNVIHEQIQEIGINYDATTVTEEWWYNGPSGENVLGVDMHLVLNNDTTYWWRYGHRLSELLIEIINSPDD